MVLADDGPGSAYVAPRDGRVESDAMPPTLPRGGSALDSPGTPLHRTS